MKYVVDIDNTICRTFMSDYKNSTPIVERITKVNELYDAGHEIWYHTARGMNSGKDWYLHTRMQLDSWGCKYHVLLMSKPSCDVWIDDKSVHPDEFFK